MTGNPLNRISEFVRWKALGAKGYSLVHLDIVANDGRFANHHSRSMVNGKVLPNGSPGVNVYAGLGMSHLGNDTGYQGYAEFQQGMSNPVIADSPYAGIAKNHLSKLLAAGSPL